MSSKVKKILVSQPKPENDKSPFIELANKNSVKIEFRPFIQIQSLSAKEFRANKVNILDHTAILLTSRHAADHFFKICEEMRITVPETMKYFCVSESTALYLQKFIVYRKRKIFYGQTKFEDLLDEIIKHKDEKFLVPVSDNSKQMDIFKKLKKVKIEYTKAVFYKTVFSDLSDISNLDYDIMVFYSPYEIESLCKNFPEFQQNDIKIASFGPATAKAVKEAGFRCDIKAPMPNAPSMTMALDMFIQKQNKKTNGKDIKE